MLRNRSATGQGACDHPVAALMPRACRVVNYIPFRRANRRHYGYDRPIDDGMEGSPDGYVKLSNCSL